jgi:hypothetical protein
MDPATLTAAALAVALPYLLALGKEAAKGAAGEAGKSVWSWMKGKLTTDAGKQAVKDLENDPNDADNQKLLEATLSKHLRGNPNAATELTSLLQQVGAISLQGDVTVTATHGGIAAGRDLTGNTITITTSRSEPKE